MACAGYIGKLDAYLDGELPAEETRQMEEHLTQCASCAARGLRFLQEKRIVQAATNRYMPDPAFRARIKNQIASNKSSFWNRRWLPVLATLSAASLLIVSFFLYSAQSNRRNEQQLVSELLDQHVATLASANPVDVVSSDRHTVKPWFQGRIPFTFNLPELQESPFILVGGRVCYIRQSPGAELLFRIRQHQISVFIVPESQTTPAMKRALVSNAFEIRTWRHNGLVYLAIGDASAQDLDQLSTLIQQAG